MPVHIDFDVDCLVDPCHRESFSKVKAADSEVGSEMISTATIAEYLEGLVFPASKEEIVEYAEERCAPPDLLQALEEMMDPIDGNYYSIAAVWDAIGTII